MVPLRAKRAFRIKGRVPLLSVLPLFLILFLSACHPTSFPVTSFDGCGGESLPLLNASGSPLVRVMLNGHAAAMLMDTGAGNSVVTPEAARMFGLEATGGKTGTQGVGGEIQTPLVRARRLELGDRAMTDVIFAEAPLPVRQFDGLTFAGLLGADVFGDRDVLLDLPHRRIVLLPATSSCSVSAKSSERIPFVTTAAGGIAFVGRLGGKPVMLLLDSGSNRTSVPLKVAEYAGADGKAIVSGEDLGGRGIGSAFIHAWRHRFSSLQIGRRVYSDADLIVEPLKTPFVLLGADFLQHTALLVSYRRQTITLMEDRN